MRILVDIDGIICENGFPDGYATAIPRPHEIESINLYKSRGTEVFIFTSRIEEDRAITEQWLKDNGVQYDSLIMNKPRADYYIDDKALPFLPHITTGQLKRKKLCIPISGGMDSFIAYHYAIRELGYNPEDIVCIFFNIGQPYFQKEKDALSKLGVPYKEIHIPCYPEVVADKLDIHNYILPNRNAIFASIAAIYGERVWIVGMKYENHYLMHDKNDAFFRISTISNTQSIGELTIIESPFSNKTKTETIEWARDNDLLEKLDDTVSCYHPREKRCGVCSLCFKRWLAMKAAGVDEHYSQNPAISDEANRLVLAYTAALEKNDFSHYSKERILETLKFIK